MIEVSSDQEAVLDRYASKWTSQGYRLVKNPHGDDLPGFLGSYRPDAILLGPQKIMVEVLYKGEPQSQTKLDALRSLLTGRDDWRLEIIYAGVRPPIVSPTSTARLRQTLERIEGMDDADPGAFVMLWPVMEAAARLLVPDETRRPQSPGRVVELLASHGIIVPSDADFLRRSANLRNRIVHGELDTAVPQDVRRRTERIAQQVVGSVEALGMAH